MEKTAFLLMIILSSFLSAQEKIMFWPKGEMPNSRKRLPETGIKKMPADTEEPALFAFLPPAKERRQMSVIVIPGGGYSKLVYDEGAFQIAKWLNTQGISAFVLKYRLPTSPDVVQRETAALQDAQAAIKYLRKNAAQWNIAPQLVGVIGTSAGGHLAASVSNIATDYTGLKNDWKDISSVPDFAVLLCPVIDLGEFAHTGSRNSLLGDSASPEKIAEYSMQNRVSGKTPPTALFHAQDDTAVPAINSILYYKAMTRHQVKGSLFIFPEGGHRFSVTNKNELNENWKKLCEDWLKSISDE